MTSFSSLLLELDKLKSVYRKSYVSGEARRENSAEHSWHLAVALLVLQNRLPADFDLAKALKMALVHDVCEIGADDVCAYHADEAKAAREESYLRSIRGLYPEFSEEATALWLEYERQETSESRWVKVLDKLLPFVLNLACEGRTWREQGITKSMILAHHKFVGDIDKELHAWMVDELGAAANKGWVSDT